MNNPFNSNKRTLSITCANIPSYLGNSILEPVRLKGTEGISQLFEYQLDLKVAANAPLDIQEKIQLGNFIGQNITVNIELDGNGSGVGGGVGLINLGAGSRQISALISQAQYLRSEGNQQVYQFTLRPALWLCTQKQNSKIYQDQSVIDVIKTLLQDYPVVIEQKLDSKNYPQREYIAQFNETDYTFFARLCEEWGIFWWIEHKEEKHQLILSDSSFGTNASAAYHALSYYPPNYKIDEEYIDDLSLKHQLVPGVWTSTDRDYTQSGTNLSQSKEDAMETAHNTLEIYDYPSDIAQPKAGAKGYQGEGNPVMAEGEHRARIRMDSLKSQAKRAFGSGNLRAIVPGTRFTLGKHPLRECNVEWAVLNTELMIEEVGETSQGSAINVLKQMVTGQKWQCRVRFELIESRVFYSPQQTIQKPTLISTRAVVTGPKDQELWTDELGRVKVKFAWDRNVKKDGKDDHTSSIWLRMDTPWAGNQFGAVHLPRVGQEVRVNFEENDIDRPYISGRAYNNRNMPA